MAGEWHFRTSTGVARVSWRELRIEHSPASVIADWVAGTVLDASRPRAATRLLGLALVAWGTWQRVRELLGGTPGAIEFGVELLPVVAFAVALVYRLSADALSATAVDLRDVERAVVDSGDRTLVVEHGEETELQLRNERDGEDARAALAMRGVSVEVAGADDGTDTSDRRPGGPGNGVDEDVDRDPTEGARDGVLRVVGPLGPSR